ncbi:NAD(P)-binding protein [Mycena indigotica]|uniref:NAD(P)-binding protein n=1 Tax=Mycena indigotica TaxID=2126181 RepID=A0A8H6SHQ6_9AGAR|nr:NAD(P)-binding protein [Mycena indigotica]KAF7299168.1 NAD(P)-binding protein [Mycena indigotica]
MGRFQLLALLVPALTAVAAPLPAKRAFSFGLKNYNAFQISDSVAGNAQAHANAVFVDPFKSVDLATVDATSLKNLGTMRQAAESAETELFNPQIKAASGAAADALSVGKIQNKVLKLTGEVQQIKIKLAQAKAKGSDTSKLQASLTEEQTKLSKNIATDVKNKGKKSKGVASKSKRAAFKGFALKNYAQFQISDGTAGNAQAKAAAVFVDPFKLVDLATVDATSIKNLGTMREAAESAETELFNPQIKAASGAAADALSVGKIQNKVLKLTGEVQQLKIKLAQAKAKGSDTSKIQSKLTEEQTKLSKNIALDVKSKGDASKGVA